MKKQESIDSGRDVVVVVNKYRIGKDDGDDGDDGDGNRDRNEMVEDVTEALSMDNAAVG